MEENFVYLMIEPDSGSHQEVTEALGLKPSKAWNTGDKKPPPSPVLRSTTKWMLESSAPRNSSLEQHTEALLSVLEPISSKVLLISGKSKARIFYASYCKNIHPGYIFSPGIINRISSLGLGLEFDIYAM